MSCRSTLDQNQAGRNHEWTQMNANRRGRLRKKERLATKDHRDLKEKFPVFYVIFFGQKSKSYRFGFVLAVLGLFVAIFRDRPLFMPFGEPWVRWFSKTISFVKIHVIRGSSAFWDHGTRAEAPRYFQIAA